VIVLEGPEGISDHLPFHPRTETRDAAEVDGGNGSGVTEKNVNET